MKLGVLTVPLYDRPLDEALSYLSDLGVQAVELGCGGSPGKTHLDPDVYLGHPDQIRKLKKMLKKYNIEIAAIAAHGNAVHPDQAIATQAKRDFENAVLLAGELGVETIVDFSGCPGDGPNARYASWPVLNWPTDFQKVRKWQWDEVLIPYWQREIQFVRQHGIKKIAFEMEPGFSVYNPATCLKLREAVGPEVGANVDPSHLIWQGIDPCEAIKALKGCIYHVHAKDTYIDERNKSVNGVLNPDALSLEERPWTFRTVGYGHDELFWRRILSTLKMVGYDGVISIEHEDPLMTSEEGLEKAVKFMKKLIIYDQPAWMKEKA